MIENDDFIVNKWEEFDLTSSNQLRTYFAFDLQLKKKLQAVFQDIREEENVEFDGDAEQQLQWEFTAGMRSSAS